MNEDVELLSQFVENDSEGAFAQLVERHLPLVFSVALRLTNGDAHLAQDIAQNVFIDLARKAPSILKRVSAQREVLPGWLHTSARYSALGAIRSKARRRKYEQIL